MVGHGEGLALTGIEQFAPQLFAHSQQPVLAQHAIKVDRPVHVGDAVLGKDDDACALSGEMVEELSANLVEFA